MEKKNCSLGCDAFYPEPGIVESCRCGVCGVICDVQRNAYGPTSWSGAMSGHSRSYDDFSCPHIEEPEHKKARALIAEMKQTNSPSLKKIMQGDLDIFVSHIRHKPTKKMQDALDDSIEQLKETFKKENNEK